MAGNTCPMPSLILSSLRGMARAPTFDCFLHIHILGEVDSRSFLSLGHACSAWLERVHHFDPRIAALLVPSASSRAFFIFKTRAALPQSSSINSAFLKDPP